MKLIFEKLFPYVLGAIAGVLWWEFGGQFPKDRNLLSATLSVSGIFVGFLATSKAILMSMSSPILDHLKRSKYFNELVSYIGEAIWVNLLFCAICVCGYFLAELAGAYATAWVLFACVAFLTFVRVTHIMLKVFRYA